MKGNHRRIQWVMRVVRRTIWVQLRGTWFLLAGVRGREQCGPPGFCGMFLSICDQINLGNRGINKVKEMFFLPN